MDSKSNLKLNPIIQRTKGIVVAGRLEQSALTGQGLGMAMLTCGPLRHQACARIAGHVASGGPIPQPAMFLARAISRPVRRSFTHSLMS